MPKKGYRHTEKTIEKIRLSLTGRELSDEHKKNMGEVRRGKKRPPFSEEWKRKISESQKGKVTPLEVRKKQSEAAKRGNYGVWLIGTKRSEETKEKIRLSTLGRVSPMKGKHHTSISRIKTSIALRGNKAPNWKGGVTKVNKLVRGSVEYRLWREAVFSRDNWTCVWCRLKSSKDGRVTLNADHIKPFALFPELRFAIDNGRTLCLDCHEKTDTYKTKNKMVLDEVATQGLAVSSFKKVK